MLAAVDSCFVLVWNQPGIVFGFLLLKLLTILSLEILALYRRTPELVSFGARPTKSLAWMSVPRGPGTRSFRLMLFAVRHTSHTTNAVFVVGSGKYQECFFSNLDPLER